MAIKVLPYKATDLHDAHVAGKSLLKLSDESGFSRVSILNAWKRLGLKQRDRSSAGLNRTSKMTAEERSAQVSAAHNAARGRIASVEERTQTALTNQARHYKPTVSEAKVLKVLRPIGTVRRQVACGVYNIDFVIDGEVAVECFGGNWHATGRAAVREGKRIEYLLNAGFHVVVVWVHNSSRIGWPAALEHVVFDLKAFRRDPTAPREYWVIRSNGEIWQSGKRENTDYAFVAPANRRRNSKGRYERAG